MNRENILSTISEFDHELYEFFQDELQKQKYTLSLMPEENYSSPLSSYMEGSILTNTLMTHHDEKEPSGLEAIVIKRVNKLFGSEHANIRTGNIGAASRVIFYTLVQKGDTILSLDNRKQDHCNTENLKFNFVKFGIEPDTQLLNLDKVEQLAQKHQPKMIIFSPVNYPRSVDYKRLSEIAKKVGAYLWVDICQKVGLIAAGEMESPVPFSDIVTFSTHDSLRGPQSAVILCRKNLAEKLDETVISTGHFALKKNILAAMAVMFKEAAAPKFKHYAQQVVNNAKALQKGLSENGVDILCGGTDTNLVLVDLNKLNMSCDDAFDKLQAAGIVAKPTVLHTSDEHKSFEILRLSSLILTTRGFKEEQMQRVGALIAKVLKSDGLEADMEKFRQEAVDMAIAYPLFSDEWLASKDVLNPLYSAGDINISHEISAEQKMAVIKKIFGFLKH